MRTAPTISSASWGTLRLADATGKTVSVANSSQASTLIAFGDDSDGTNCLGIVLLFNISDAGFTRYTPCYLRTNGTAGIDFSAEILR